MCQATWGAVDGAQVDLGTFRIAEGAAVCGVAREGSEPRAGAEVKLYAIPNSSLLDAPYRGVELTTHTNNEGEFKFTGLIGPGRWIVVATRQGTTFERARDLIETSQEVVVGQSRDQVRVELNLPIHD